MNIESIQLSLGISKEAKKLVRCLCKLVIKGLTVFPDNDVFQNLSKIIDLRFLENISGRNVREVPDDIPINSVTKDIIRKRDPNQKEKLYIIDTLSQSLLKMAQVIANKDRSDTIKLNHITHVLRTSLFEEIVFGIELFFQRIYIYSENDTIFLVYGGGTFLQNELLKKTCRWNHKEKVWKTKKMNTTILKLKKKPNLFVIRNKYKRYLNAPDEIKNSFSKFLHINTLYKGKSQLLKDKTMKMKKDANEIIKRYLSSGEIELPSDSSDSIDDTILSYYIYKRFHKDLSSADKDIDFVRRLAYHLIPK